MTVFVEVTCGVCGSFEVIPVADVVRRESPFQCQDCHGPVSVDVLYDFDPSDADWYSNAIAVDEANPRLGRIDYHSRSPTLAHPVFGGRDGRS